MMKNPLNVLEVKEDDNLLTAAGKGGMKGTVVAGLISVAVYGAMIFIGTKTNKSDNSVLEEIQDIIEEAK